jgi:Spy/CpxP family protein refolding chaperone
MERRTMIGLAAGIAASLAVGAGAAVGVGAAHAHGGWRAGIMKRMVSAAIDDALDKAQTTAEQRRVIYAARDRVFATVEEVRAGRHSHLEEGLAMFEADQVDPARVEALHQEAEAGRQRIREAIHQALVEAHDVLTAPQRKAVADYIRSHGAGHFN